MNLEELLSKKTKKDYRQLTYDGIIEGEDDDDDYDYDEDEEY